MQACLVSRNANQFISKFGRKSANGMGWLIDFVSMMAWLLLFMYEMNILYLYKA